VRWLHYGIELKTMKQKAKKYLLDESDLEWIVEALNEGYSKKQLAKQYKISVRQLNAELKGDKET